MLQIIINYSGNLFPNCNQLFRNNRLQFGIEIPEIMFRIVTNYSGNLFPNCNQLIWNN